MSTMMTENGTTDTVEVAKRVEALEKAQAVQAATEAGAQATQAATLAGAQTTQAAAHAGNLGDDGSRVDRARRGHVSWA
jgi:hypothetical protein